MGLVLAAWYSKNRLIVSICLHCLFQLRVYAIYNFLGLLTSQRMLIIVSLGIRIYRVILSELALPNFPPCLRKELRQNISAITMRHGRPSV